MNITESKSRPIHAPHPSRGFLHPFKIATLCGKAVRFGGIEIPNDRTVSCKICLKIQKTLCPKCKGTGVKK